MSYSYQKGVAAIEFTILLPVLLLLVFITAELGRALYQYGQLTRMVRDAGRYLSITVMRNTTGVLPESIANGCDTNAEPSCDDICNDCIEEMRELLSYGELDGSVPLLRGIDESNVIVSGDSGTKTVTISVDYDWQPLFGERVSGFGLGSSSDLSFNFNVSYTLRAL
ncbi:TadE family protein [Shewanella nanhaiensis]|uniref:Pilus assembly protein n=1 Tax=Shewanella nanhaiensis TaxID=2864872 RepID=A0ABS7E593_9GAMM|nr:TadE family protein [Shewanella nanhaiensis]MBW8184720.1 pilus assembly protein [Shewanella nanhaiensis]